MKQNIAVAGVAAVVLSFGATAFAQSALVAADTLTLSLDECLNVALSESPTIKVADMEMVRMDYGKKETLGQLLPTLNFGGSYNRTLAKQVVYMNMDGFGGFGGGSGSGSGSTDTPSSDSETPQSRASGSTSGSRQGIKMGLDNSYQVGFSASMPLIAPQLWASLKLSDSQILQSVESARSSRIQLVSQIKNAYYALLLTNDSYGVIRGNYDNAVFNHEVFQKKFLAGTASEYDVLRSEVQVKNIEPELLQAEIAIKQARLQLAMLMGLDASAAIVKPTSKLSDYEADMYGNTLALDPSSLDGNTSLRSLDLQTRTLEQTLNVQKMAWYPTLSVSANYNWISSTQGAPFTNLHFDPYSMVGLTLNFPLYQGGQRSLRIKQAKLQVDEMGLQRQNLERSVRMQAELAIDNIQKNVKQIAGCSQTVAQAEKAHQIMEKSFEVGAATYLSLRDAELALTQARLAYYQSIYNYLVATSDLELLLGNVDLSKYTGTNEK